MSLQTRADSRFERLDQALRRTREGYWNDDDFDVFDGDRDVGRVYRVNARDKI
jgi:hypothetical protein